MEEKTLPPPIKKQRISEIENYQPQGLILNKQRAVRTVNQMALLKHFSFNKDVSNMKLLPDKEEQPKINLKLVNNEF